MHYLYAPQTPETSLFDDVKQRPDRRRRHSRSSLSTRVASTSTSPSRRLPAADDDEFSYALASALASAMTIAKAETILEVSGRCSASESRVLTTIYPSRSRSPTRSSCPHPNAPPALRRGPRLLTYLLPPSFPSLLRPRQPKTMPQTSGRPSMRRTRGPGERSPLRPGRKRRRSGNGGRISAPLRGLGEGVRGSHRTHMPSRTLLHQACLRRVLRMHATW